MSSNVLDDIRGNFHGKVVMPGDGEYDEARSVFNAMIDKGRPRSSGSPTSATSSKA